MAAARRDGELSARISAIHRDSRGTYGVPRVHAELAEDGERVARKRVARLMRARGLRGVSRRKWRPTTLRDDAETPVPDLVERDFTVWRSNALWVADATYIPASEGFLFLVVVVVVYSRRVVGWSMGSRLVTALMLDAPDMALGQRDARDVIHHSDHGSQYTSIEFGQRCREAGVFVVSGPLFERNMHPVPGADEAHVVPSGYWKVVAVNDEGRIRISAFWFDHETDRRPTHCDEDHNTTVRSIEMRTGLNYLHRLDAGKQERLETQTGSLAQGLGCAR